MTGFVQKYFLISCISLFIIPSTALKAQKYFYNNWKLKVSSNGHFLQYENGKPFFWLGDTGWLLFSKLNRKEAGKYIEDRSKKGFNVIQAMVIHQLPQTNIYGDSAFINNNPADPKVTPGADPDDSVQYDFWDHVDYIFSLAARKGMFIAMVPIWGSNIRSHKIDLNSAESFVTWLAERYKDKPNIIWINGGDTKGSENTEVWNKIGTIINRIDTAHLITFHPFGRTQSSAWFNNAAWLSFNMIQSGHKDYAQDSTGYGEDNWKYVQEDYNKRPAKPTLDAEPSYENIPHGLHNPAMPYWNDNDVRRYAYWSVFAGACGFTYGDNGVMQMYRPGERKGAYGVKDYWFQALNDPGSSEMIYLKKLILSRPYFQRIPDQTIVAGSNGKRYDYLAAARGNSYLFIYTYNGRNFHVNMGKISGKYVNAFWYNLRNGKSHFFGRFLNKGSKEFNPPGEKENGNDWVLILEDTSSGIRK